MSLKWIIALVAVIVLQAGASLWLSHRLQETREELGSTSALVESQKASLAALAASQARIQAATAAVTKRNQELSNDLQRRIDELPDRGERRTPEPVVDSLCKRLKCAHSDD